MLCRACGFGYSGQEPNTDELRDYYGHYTMIRDLSPITAKRYDELLASFAPYRRSGRLLEVGAGGGLFLDRARSAGWQCHGTEYDPAIVAECRARGLIMHDGALPDHPWESGSFDVVVSFEVVEHLPRPMDDLRAMVDLLRPGGVLYITTPNFNSISKLLAYGKWTIVNYPEHISFFNPSNMHRALTSLGMRRIWVRTTGISLSRFRISHGMGTATTTATRNDEQLRRTIESRPMLRSLKKFIDGILNVTGKGDSLKVLYEKPVQ